MFGCFKIITYLCIVYNNNQFLGFILGLMV